MGLAPYVARVAAQPADQDPGGAASERRSGSEKTVGRIRASPHHRHLNSPVPRRTRRHLAGLRETLLQVEVCCSSP